MLIGKNLKYCDKGLLEVAHQVLKGQESFFSTTHHSDVYNEWAIVDKVSNFTTKQIDYFYHVAHEYPYTHQVLQDSKSYIYNSFSLVYPEELQKRINKLRELTWSVFLDQEEEAYKAFPQLAYRTNCSDSSISYYREVIEAFKKVADIYTSENIESSLVSQVSKLASDLTFRADMSNTKSLSKIQGIKFDKKTLKTRDLEQLLMEPESKTLEFKSSLIFDIQKDVKNKSLSTQCLKTLVAFLNTDGGTLLIGVNDDGKVIGLNTEIERYHSGSRDKFNLMLSDLIKSKIGAGYLPLIQWELISLSGQLVMEVKCKKSPLPCFLSTSGFYIRTNAASYKLEAEEAELYKSNHFSI